MTDVEALMAEVEAEVGRKRAAGLYPPDVMVEIDASAPPAGAGNDRPHQTGADVVSASLVDLQRSSHVSGLVTTASHKPVIAPLISSARRAIRSSLTWYMNGILEQVNKFADNTVRTVGLLSERSLQLDGRIESLERRVGGLDEWRSVLDEDHIPNRLSRLDRAVRDLRERLERGVPAAADAGTPRPGPRPDAGAFGVSSRDVERSFDYLEFENRFRGDPEVIADRQRFYLDLFAGATAPVVDLGCGRGEFLGLLKDAGIPCYGVDRHPDMVASTRAMGIEILEADSLEHLASLEPGSLGGIFCSQMVEHLPTVAVPRLFELAADALAPGAALAVETINPESLFVFAHAFYVDLGHTRPLHPLTLEFLAGLAGFAEVKVEYLSPPPPEFRPERLAAPADDAAGDAALAGLVARIDENFRKIDDLLFGPQDFAIVARR